MVRDPEKVAWLSQTTLSVDETMATVDAIRQRFPQLLDPPSDDICYATQNRQLAIKEISQRGRPGDRGRLGQLLELGAAGRGRPGGRRARRRTGSTTPARSTRPGSTASRRVSVTSGASVPEDLVDGVLAFLAERGYPDAQAVHTAEESLIFALPPELRRDLRTAAADGPS